MKSDLEKLEREIERLKQQTISTKEVNKELLRNIKTLEEEKVDLVPLDSIPGKPGNKNPLRYESREGTKPRVEKGEGEENITW